MQLSSKQKQFIIDHEHENVSTLALQDSLFIDEDKLFLLTQISGRQIAKNKIPILYNNENIIYPVHLSLEQSSSELTARFKASLFPDKKEIFVDLTGGFGIDFMFLSTNFFNSVYVETDQRLCDIAEYNFHQLGLNNVSIIHSNAESYIRETNKVDLLFLDPSRRNSDGRKVFRIEDCSPNLAEIAEILVEKADKVLIKYSPMLDISLALKTLLNVVHVYVVSVENECKELLFLMSKEKSELEYHTVNLKKNGDNETFLFSPEDEQNCKIEFTSQLGNYLYEPNASILKAGGFTIIADRYGVKKLHRNSHLYTSEEMISSFPGRKFKIENVISPNKRHLQTILAETKKANIAVRNFPMSVEEIRKKTRLKEGGDIYLFATTLVDEKKVWIICRKADKN